MMDTAPLWTWVNERHAIFLRKSLREGAEPGTLSTWSNGYLDRPAGDELRWSAKGLQHWSDVRRCDAFTRDPILQQYRFCNVFRELDRVTAWIRYNIRRPYAHHPNLWLMLAIARYINWPETLQRLMEYEGAWPKYADDAQEFSPERLGAALDYLKGELDKLYTGAYMIRAESNPKAEWYSWTKQQYIARIVIGRLWETRDRWAKLLAGGDFPGEPVYLQEVWQYFQSPHFIGWGPFMAYQVVVDMRHTRLLGNAPDIDTWAALGPGSRRGLNRLAGRPLDYPLTQEQGLQEMRAIHAEQDSRRAPWVPHIELSDIQNALCETDKYLRAKLGEGRPRAQYVPGRGY